MTKSKPGTVVGQLPCLELQLINERRFSKKHINGYIETAIVNNKNNQGKLITGVRLLSEWLQYWKAPYKDQCSTEKFYDIKNARIAQLDNLNAEEIVKSIFIQTAYCQIPELFVSVTAMLASKLGMSDKRESIQTIAEIVGVLCETDAYDIHPSERGSSMMITSNLDLPESLYEAVERSMYLPPMVCPPINITNNFESGYLTHNDCVILGKGNGHVGDICLDVINTQNKIALKLDTDFLSTVEEEPTFDLDTAEKANMWKKLKRVSYEVYLLIVKQGNQFYLTNKVDKRGRLYPQGYHISTQGSPQKKAMVELYNELLIEGLPK